MKAQWAFNGKFIEVYEFDLDLNNLSVYR